MNKIKYVLFLSIFMVLLFVYPLKFLATLVVNHVFIEGWFGIDMPNLISFKQGQYHSLHALYAVGFAAIFLCFAWLYKIALAEKDALELTTLEEHHTRTHMIIFVIVAVVPLLTIIILYLPYHNAPMWAGFGNSLIWPATWWYGARAAKQAALLEPQEEASNG